MKPNPKNPRMLYCSALIVAVVLVLPNRVTAADISGDNVTTNLTINGNTTANGWGLFKEGLDFGNDGESTLNWWPGTAPAGVLTFDIKWTDGTFTWRDAVTSNTFTNKMTLNAANVLTLYKANGTTVGVTIAPETGVINLTGTNNGISVNGTSLFSVSSVTGQVTFANNRPTGITSTTPSTCSATGALTVVGGIGAGMDSFFNGVRVGRGSGYNNTANTALGTSALSANGYGSNNSAIGYNALFSNTYGTSNAALGTYALYSNVYGGSNSSMGVNSGYNNYAGSSNVFLGYDAGRWQSNGTIGLSNPQSSVYIGANVRGFDSNDSNSIVIGANAIGIGANTTVIGNSSTQKTVIYGSSVSLAGGITTSSVAAAINGGVASNYGATAISGGLAGGASSFAVGDNASASSASSVAFGRYNTTWGTNYGWTETDPLLLVGNGTGSSASFTSNAITTLKNGQTTLTNKAWKANHAVLLTTDNSNGEALVVEGNTRLTGNTVLEGKVVISIPQGDISMGIYGN